MNWDHDGLRSLVAGLAAACLATSLTTRTLRGWWLFLAPPVLGLAAGAAAIAALPGLGQGPTLPWAGWALCVGTGLTAFTILPRERRGPPAWPAGTWLALHLFAVVGVWIGLGQAAQPSAQLGSTTGLVVVALAGAWCSRRVPRAARSTIVNAPILAAGLQRPPFGVAIALLTLALASGGLQPAEGWRALLITAALIATATTLWAGRLEAAVLVLLPGAVAAAAALGAAGWCGVALSSTAAAGALGLGAALGLRQAALELSRHRGSGADPAAGGDTLVAGALLSVGALTLLLAEHPQVSAAGWPLAAGLGLATLSALSLTGPLCARLARAPQAGDPLARRYRWLGAWTSLQAAVRARRDPLLRRLPELVGGAQEVLVAGSGSGLALTRLATSSPELRLRAVELDPAKLQRSQAALTPDERQRVTTVLGDLRQVELGQPDLILLLDVLQAWPPTEQRELLTRLAQALRPGGQLLFRGGCPGPDTSHLGLELAARLAWRLGLETAGRPPRFASATDYGRRLNEAGLAVVKAYPELGSAARLVLLCKKA